MQYRVIGQPLNQAQQATNQALADSLAQQSNVSLADLLKEAKALRNQVEEAGAANAETAAAGGEAGQAESHADDSQSVDGVGTMPVPKHVVSLEQLSDYGNKVKSVLQKFCPNPVILISGPGSGKTKMMELLAKEMGYKRVGVMFNSQSPAKVVFGNFYPTKSAGEGLLEWQDGRMVKALRPLPNCKWIDGQPKQLCICPKTMIHIDEFNRQDEDVQVRWLTVLEDTGRWMHLVENHQEEFPVHPNVWVVGTMNPQGQSVTINPIEPALLDRLRIIEVDSPMVNEKKVLSEILPSPLYDADLTTKLISMARESRRNEETAISTRALVMIAKSLVYGVKLDAAIKINLLNTSTPRDKWDTIDALYKQFFLDDVKYGGKVLPSKTGV